MKILQVEDSEADAIFAARELKKPGYDVDSKRVWTEESFVEALRSFGPDIILSDMELPGFSGEHALELARTHHCDAAFIFVSGSSNPIDADRATEANRQYVSKNDLTSLGIAVDRAMKGGHRDTPVSPRNTRAVKP